MDGDALSIRHCLDDLARAEARALELAPGARVVYFSSSFGAYLNLIYLSTRPHRGTRSFLRSAAVEMPLLFHSPTPEQAEELARQGFLMLDQGYVRPLKLTPAFLADLDAHDLFQLYRSGEERVCMIHGDEDQTASPEAARRFARPSAPVSSKCPAGTTACPAPACPSWWSGRPWSSTWPPEPSAQLDALDLDQLRPQGVQLCHLSHPKIELFYIL